LGPCKCNMVFAEDIRHAYLSEVAYATLKSESYSQARAWERVNAALKSQEIASKIGNNWEVLTMNGRHLSNQDAAVVINRVDHKVALLCRGTVTFLRDILIEDIGAGLHLTHDRAARIFQMGKAAKNFVESHQGYSLSATGHSLGGSLAAEIGSLLGCDTYTYDAPDLRHGAGEATPYDKKNFVDNKLHAFRLENDPVSLIGVNDTNAETLTSKDHLIGLSAHKLKPLINALEDSFRSLHGTAPNASNTEVVIKGIEHVDGFKGGAVWSSDRNDVAFFFYNNQVQHIQYVYYHKDGNLLFERDVTTTVVFDRNGKGISESVQLSFHLSQHSQAAVDAGVATAVNEALGSIVSKNTHIDLQQLSKDAVTAMGKGFASSVLAVSVDHALESLVANGGLKLAENVIAGTIQKGGIDAAFALLHGDKQSAVKASIDSLASSVLQFGLGIPLSYATNYQVSNASLFGSRIVYSSEKSFELGLSPSTVLDRIVGHVSLGLAVSRISDVYTLSNNQLVLREAGGVDGYIHVGPASVSLGVYRGVETYQPLTSKYQNAAGTNIRLTSWGRKSFEGKIMFRVHVGNRLFAANVFPAWRSTKLTFWEEHRTDGNPFDIRHSNHNTYIESTGLAGGVTLDSLETNLPTLKEYQESLVASSAYAPQDSKSSASGGAASAVDSSGFDTTTSIENSSAATGVEPIHIKTSSVLDSVSHASHVNQLMLNQGHTESVMSHYGTHKEKTSDCGLTKHTVDQEFNSLAIHEAATEVSTTVSDGFMDINVHRTDVDLTATDRTRLKDVTYTAGKGHRGNKDWTYAPGQDRTYNNDMTTTTTDFTATKRADGKDISMSSNTTHNAKNEEVTQVRRVQELGKEVYHCSSGTSGGFTDETGILETTTDHGIAKLTDAVNNVVVETHEFDKVIEAFGDIRSETTNGSTINYEIDQKQEYKFEVGTQHIKQEVVVEADHSPFSTDHSIGKQDLNGVQADNCTMDVYAKEKVTSVLTEHKFDSDGNMIANGSVVTTDIVDKVHGTFTVLNKSVADESVGKYHNQSVKMSSVKNEFVQGSASCTVNEVKSVSDGTASIEANYAVGEKELTLDSKVLGKQYINTVTAEKGEVLRSSTGSTALAADGSKTTVVDQYTRIDDITTQTANLDSQTGGDPSLSINDLKDLSVEEGGITGKGDSKKTGKNLQGDVSRKRVESGFRVQHVESKPSARGTVVNTIISQDSDDVLNPLKQESTIVEGTGENAKLSETKTTVDTSVNVTVHNHVERSLGLFHFSDTIKTTTDTADSTKPQDGVKHDTKTTTAVSAGTSRGAGSLTGGTVTLALVWACEGKAPTVQSAGNVLVSGAESFLVANATSLMDATGNICSGLSMIGGVAAAAALCRIGLDVYYGQTELMIPSDLVRRIDRKTEAIAVGTRVEANANRSGKFVAGKVIVVHKEKNSIFYDIKYDTEKEMMAVNATSSIATSTLQAVAASNAIGLVTVLGSTVGGGVIMAIPMVIDIVKVAYQMARGKVSVFDGGVMIATSVGGIVAGGLASYGVTAGIAAAVGTTAALTSAAGIGVVIAGAVAFSTVAYFTGRAIKWALYRWFDNRRIAELRKKYNIGDDYKSKRQMESIARKLKRACHPDKGGGSKIFVQTTEDLEELFKLEEKVGHFKYYEKEGDTKILSWTGYTLAVIRHMKEQGAAVAEQFIDLISVKSYEAALAKAKEDLNQKQKIH
jgi:hypothetical protein